MADFLEQLQILGSYGLSVEKSFPINDFYNADGYGFSVINGDSRGLKVWKLTFDFLADDSSCTVTLPDHLGGGTQTYFQYYTRFFDRHHSPALKPFTITCPEDGEPYTVVFADHKRELVYNTFKLWTTGVRLVQVRTANELALPPGMSGNNSEI